MREKIVVKENIQIFICFLWKFSFRKYINLTVALYIDNKKLVTLVNALAICKLIDFCGSAINLAPLFLAALIRS